MTTPPHPFLTHYTAVHRQQRIDTTRLVTALDTAVVADRRDGGRLQALARWAAGFGHELRLHHTVEDNVIFPAVVDRVPELASLSASLDADHVRVATLIERLAPAVAAVADPTMPMTEAQAGALAVAVELRDLLHTHLDVEDAEMLPTIVARFQAQEFDALTARAQKSLPKKGLSFSVPWNVAALPDAERATLVSTAPLPLRVIYYATRGSYARLVAAAFDGIAAPQLIAA